MAESLLHKKLIQEAEQFLRDNGCGIVVTEATAVGWKALPYRPDVFGVVTDPRSSWKRWLTIEIECEPDLRGIEDEMKKTRTKSFSERPGLVHYLMYPDNIDPDLDTLEVDTSWGLIESGFTGPRVVRQPAKMMLADYSEVALLSSMILNLQRETGKQAQEARSSHGARLSPKDIQKVHDCLVSLHDELAPDTPLRAICNHTGIDRKKLLKACKAGIPGFKYDAEQQTLMIEEPATASK